MRRSLSIPSLIAVDIINIFSLLLLRKRQAVVWCGVVWCGVAAADRSRVGSGIEVETVVLCFVLNSLSRAVIIRLHIGYRRLRVDGRARRRRKEKEHPGLIRHCNLDLEKRWCYRVQKKREETRRENGTVVCTTATNSRHCYTIHNGTGLLCPCSA